MKRKINGRVCRLSAHVGRGVPAFIDAPALEVWLDQVRQSKVAFDVGANIGIWSALAAVEISPGGLIYAFEPAPGTFKWLEDGARVSLGPGKIVPVHAAVGATTGEADFLLHGDVAATNRIALGLAAERPTDRIVRVPMVTLDQFCAERGVLPQVVKIDVEGAELLVLNGMRGLLHRADLWLVIELHWSSAFNVTPEALLRYAREVGYQLRDGEGQSVRSQEELITQNFVVMQRS